MGRATVSANVIFNKPAMKRLYDRLRSEARQKYKGKSSICERILQRLDTMEAYENYASRRTMMAPLGVQTYVLPFSTECAVKQAMDIAHGTATEIKDPQRLTNYRFYINTPYYDRASVDNFPLFTLEDPRVSEIVTLVRAMLCNFDTDKGPDSLLNIIVRIYRPGDVLNFHTDREDFGKYVYGLVLLNSDPSHGLMITDQKRVHYMLEECPGLTWCLADEARWSYRHGYCADNSKEEFVRISVTCRYFNEARLIPKYNKGQG